MSRLLDKVAGDHLQALKERALIREHRTFSPRGATSADANRQALQIFSSNDYLGLATHTRVKQAIKDATESFGQGLRASSLVCGHTNLHQELEVALTEVFAQEKALLLPSGYAANIGALTAFASADTEIFSDQLNHASIIDGCRLAARSGARISIFPHRNIRTLETLLKNSHARIKIIVTETVFGMDGDCAPLVEIVALKKRFGAALMVDEGHASLVLGSRGGGLSEMLGLESEVDLVVATLSKAFGGLGGVILSTEKVVTYVLHAARPFVFSTSLPVPVVAGVLEALNTFCNDADIQRSLHKNVITFREQTGLQLASAERLPIPIVPIIFGDNTKAVAASEILWDAGFHVPAIRPPTVPDGTARLRVSLSAKHDKAVIHRLAEHITQLCRDLPSGHGI